MRIYEPELTRMLFDGQKTRDFIADGLDEGRKQLAIAAIDLLQHQNHGYIPSWEIELNGSPSYRCKHEFTKDELIMLGLFHPQSFYKNKEGHDRFKSATLDDHPFVTERKAPVLTNNLKRRLHRLNEGLYLAEIVARSIDPKSGELIHPEYLDYQFCGKVYRQDMEKIMDDDKLLLIPEWKLFLQDADYTQWPIIARHYERNLFFESSTYRKFSPDGIGEIVLADDPAYVEMKFRELRVGTHGGMYEKIDREPHIPVSLKLQAARCGSPFHGCY